MRSLCLSGAVRLRGTRGERLDAEERNCMHYTASLDKT
jgi:hypothetical protein